MKTITDRRSLSASMGHGWDSILKSIGDFSLNFYEYHQICLDRDNLIECSSKKYFPPLHRTTSIESLPDDGTNNLANEITRLVFPNGAKCDLMSVSAANLRTGPMHDSFHSFEVLNMVVRIFHYLNAFLSSYSSNLAV